VSSGDPTRLGIADPLRFAHHALEDELRSRGASLNESDYDDCVSHLLVVLCTLAARYDPDRGQLSFSTLSYRILRRRYTDWLRQRRGDSRYGNDGREETVADVGDYGGASTDSRAVAAVMRELDHDTLSPRAKGALHEIGLRVASGMSVTDAAGQLAKSRREASGDLDRLRMELAS
jgi:DNA-directed RNA polymerase specialized sigma24 family protein